MIAPYQPYTLPSLAISKSVIVAYPCNQAAPIIMIKKWFSEDFENCQCCGLRTACNYMNGKLRWISANEFQGSPFLPVASPY